MSNSILIFLVSPVISIYLLLKNKFNNNSKIILILLCGYWGLTMAIIDEYSDANRIISKFNVINNNNLNDTILNNIINGTQIDFIEPLILYFCSYLSNNYKIVFLIYGLIFGYFYINNIKNIYDKYKAKNFTITILIVLLISAIPIYEINGFRMWVSAQILFYGMYKYFYKKEVKYLILTFVTPFIHASYIFIIIPLIIYILLIKIKPIKALLVIYLFSFGITELQVDIRDLGINLPVTYQKRVEGYGNVEAYNIRKDNPITLNWYIKYQYRILNYLIVGLFTIVLLNIKLILNNSNEKEKHLIIYSLIFGIISNITANLTVLSATRFVNVSYLFVLSILIISFTKIYTSDKRKILENNLLVKSIMLFITVFFVVVQIRKLFEFTGLGFILLNPILAVFVDINKSLIQLIK